MSSDRNLTGTWVGEYFQHGQPHPIVAEFLHEGDVLTGSMRDGTPDKDLSVTEVTAGEAPGTDERVVATLRSMFPDQPAAPIRYLSHLPEASTLEGHVRGTGVTFLKSYQGSHYGGYKVGDVVVGQQIDGHTVHYSGRLALDHNGMEGRWWIAPVSGVTEHRIEGSFILRRHRV